MCDVDGRITTGLVLYRRTSVFWWLGINDLSYKLRCCLLTFSLAPATYTYIMHERTIYIHTHKLMTYEWTHDIRINAGHTYARKLDIDLHNIYIIYIRTNARYTSIRTDARHAHERTMCVHSMRINIRHTNTHTRTHIRTKGLTYMHAYVYMYVLHRICICYEMSHKKRCILTIIRV